MRCLMRIDNLCAHFTHLQALFHGSFVDASFSMVFYKQILSKGLKLMDLENTDAELYDLLRKVKWDL